MQDSIKQAAPDMLAPRSKVFKKSMRVVTALLLFAAMMPMLFTLVLPTRPDTLKPAVNYILSTVANVLDYSSGGQANTLAVAFDALLLSVLLVAGLLAGLVYLFLPKLLPSLFAETDTET